MSKVQISFSIIDGDVSRSVGAVEVDTETKEITAFNPPPAEALYWNQFILRKMKQRDEEAQRATEEA